MLLYRAAVDLSRSTLNCLAGVIRRHRAAIGSAWRLLNPGQQALLALVHLRKDETFTQLGAGFEVPRRASSSPVQGRDKPDSQKQANRSHAKFRGSGERANAQVKSWKLLRKLRCSPGKAGHLVKAVPSYRATRSPEDEKGAVCTTARLPIRPIPG